MEIITLKVDEENQGDRIDQYVSEQISFLSRTQVVQLIKNGDIKVGGESVKASYRLQSGEELAVSIPDPIQVMIEPQDIPLQIIYEDHDLAVIDKPQGMVVHPAAGNWNGTLVNALMFHIKDLSGINGEIRPGIVHRLDKDTSGLLVVAKNDNSHRSLAEQMKNHTVIREYTALTHGHINENQGKVDAPIGRNHRDRKKMAVVSGGRSAITWYTVMQKWAGYTLVRCKLETGRTHQIRVHMAYIGHPVVGDPVYGPRKNEWDLDKQMLHASHLAFEHPTNGRFLEFDSPLPPYFDKLLTEVRGEG